MIITKYRPSFFEGFEEKTYEVNSKEELMDCELVKNASKYGGEICFSYSDDSSSCIMVVIENPEEECGCEWWVVSVITDRNDARNLKGWLPDWKETVCKYEAKKKSEDAE